MLISSYDGGQASTHGGHARRNGERLCLPRSSGITLYALYKFTIYLLIYLLGSLLMMAMMEEMGLRSEILRRTGSLGSQDK